MGIFANYTKLTAPAFYDEIGVVKDISEATAALQTKSMYLYDLLKYGPWAGTVKISASGTTVTLADTDPIFVDMTPSAAHDVSLPAKAAANHMFVIRNLSGTYTVTVKRSGGATVTTVAAGETKFVIPSAINDFTALTLGSSSGVSDGDKGDITVSASGATWTIDASTITLAKMADMATASLLGRNTAGTGAPEVLSASTARTLLGLVIGTNVQAYDAELAALAGLTSAADALPYFTGAGTASTTTLSSFARTLLDDAAATNARTTLGLAIGTDVQAYHAKLADIAGITYAQGDVLYFNGTNIVKLAAGTSGQFLKTQGAAANPIWATIAGGGDLLAANNLSDLASAATARTNLGLAIGTNVQAYDADLAALAGLTSAANSFPYFTGSGTASLLVIVSAIRTLLASADVATFRTNAGLAIGTNVQAYHAKLADIAGITYAQGDILYYNGTNIVKLAAGTSGQFLKTQGAAANPIWATIAGGGDLLAANNLSDLVSAATARTNLGLAIGTNVQAYDADLAALAGLTSAADALPYFTGAGTASTTTLTTFGRSLIDDADAATARTTLGALGTAGGTLTGEVDLGENAGLVLDAALSADGKYSGITENGTAGATLAFGDLCYLQTADSRWELVDANAAATCSNKLGMCVLAAAADGSATKMLLFGKIRADAAFPALTIGAPVFASTTAGDIQTTSPSGAADIIRIIGHANTADELHFAPSNDYFEHA